MGDFGGGGAGRDAPSKPGKPGKPAISVEVKNPVSSGGGGGNRLERSPEEQARLDAEARAQEAAKAKAEADAKAQADAKAKLDLLTKQSKQRILSEQLQAQQRNLQAQNFADRNKFNKGEISSEELQTRINQNTFDYLQKRVDTTGRAETVGDYVIQRGQVVNKKTGEIYSTLPETTTAQQVSPITSQVQQPPEDRSILGSVKKLGTGVDTKKIFVDTLNARSIKGGFKVIGDVFESVNTFAKNVGQSYRENIPRLTGFTGITNEVTIPQYYSSGGMPNYQLTDLNTGKPIKTSSDNILRYKTFTPDEIGSAAEASITAPIYATNAGYILGAYESGKSFKQAMNPENSPGKRIVYGAAGTLGFGLIGREVSAGLTSTQRVVRPQRIIREVITTPEGQVFIKETKVKPSSSEQYSVRPLVNDAGQGIVGEVITTRETPREIVSKPVGAGKWFFGEGEVIPISSRIDTAFTPKIAPLIINEQGQIVSSGIIATQRKGANLKKFSILQGSGKNVEGDIYAQLSPAQRKAFFGKTGVRTMPDTTQVGAGYSEMVNAFRGTPTKDGFTISGYGYGRKTTRAEAVGTATKVYENPFVEIYNTRTNVIDISKPSLRKLTPKEIASMEFDEIIGNLEKRPVDYTPYFKSNLNKKEAITITGRAKVIKEPLDQRTNNGVDFVITDKPIKQITQEQIQTLQAQTAGMVKLLPKVKSYKPSPRGSILTGANLEELPTIVGGKGLSRSAFAGQGTYERIETTGAIKMPGTKSQSIINTNVDIDTKGQLDTSTQEDLMTRNISKEKPILDIFSRSNVREEIRQPIKEIQSDVLAQEQRQEQRQIKIPRSPLPLKPKPPIPLKPKPPIPPIKSFSGGAIKGKSKIFSNLKKAFDVITYKRGKEVVIGKNLPEGRAKQLGTSTVLRTLRASFKLRPRGSTSQEDIDFKVPGNAFRPSKRDANRFVQRKNLRLGSRSEISEIIKIPKRSKSRRRKISWW